MQDVDNLILAIKNTLVKCINLSGWTNLNMNPF